MTRSFGHTLPAAYRPLSEDMEHGPNASEHDGDSGVDCSRCELVCQGISDAVREDRRELADIRIGGLGHEIARAREVALDPAAGVARARLARAITWTGSTTSSAWSSRVSLASRGVDDLVALCFGVG
jgi:hypothetical protein